MTTDLFMLARAVHFGSCLLLFGWLAFGLLILPAVSKYFELFGYWNFCLRRTQWILLPLILLSGGAWFALVAMNMSDGPLQLDILKTVWQQTQFGTVSQCRLLFWLAATGLAVFQQLVKPSSRNILLWLQLSAAGLLLGSLAWAGHGRESSLWHLLADTLHLLVAGVWPTGLLPLFLLLRRLHHASPDNHTVPVISLVRRFSVSSLICVTLLSATGLVNSWFLVGSFANLFSKTYGHWLLLKVILFLLTVAIGAVNLLWLKPHLSRHKNFPAAAAQIRWNVLLEIILATAIIIIVAILGILPPAIAP